MKIRNWTVAREVIETQMLDRMPFEGFFLDFFQLTPKKCFYGLSTLIDEYYDRVRVRLE